MGTEFRSEKIPRNRLGTVSESSFRGIPSSAEEPIPKLGTEQNRTEFLHSLHSLSDQSDYLYITLSSFLFRGMVRNEIPRVCFYFCSMERNSELFSLPLKGLEKNSETLIPFWFHGKESLDLILFVSPRADLKVINS